MKSKATIVRQLLTLTLLLFFSSEHVALTYVVTEESPAIAHHYNIVQPHVQTFYSVLAESNEERDQKDDIVLPLEREVVHSLLIPEYALIHYPLDPGAPGPARSLPIYSVYCSFLI